MTPTAKQSPAERELYLAMAEILEDATEALVGGDAGVAAALSADVAILGQALGVMAKRGGSERF